MSNVVLVRFYLALGVPSTSVGSISEDPRFACKTWLSLNDGQAICTDIEGIESIV